MTIFIYNLILILDAVHRKVDINMADGFEYQQMCSTCSRSLFLFIV